MASTCVRICVSLCVCVCLRCDISSIMCTFRSMYALQATPLNLCGFTFFFSFILLLLFLLRVHIWLSYISPRSFQIVPCTMPSIFNSMCATNENKSTNSRWAVCFFFFYSIFDLIYSSVLVSTEKTLCLFHASLAPILNLNHINV